MVLGPCACSTSVYVQSLSTAHALAMDWRFVRVLPLILNLLWHELFYDPPFFIACFLQGPGLA